MLTLIIPCYNEDQVLRQLFARVQRAALDWHEDWEIVLIDDGSHDHTWELIEQFHDEDSRWKGINLARNFGHQAAIGAGLEHATGDAVVILDADLQDPPELIVHMLEKWHEGYDVVYGVRTRRLEAWLKRLCASAFYRLLARSTRFFVPRDAGDFCLLDRRVVDVLRSFSEQRPFWRGLRCWTGYRQIGVPFERGNRQAGDSHYSWSTLFKLASDGLFALTDIPKRAILVAASLATLLMLFLGAFVLIRSPSASLSSTLQWSILFFGSVQLLSLGVLAEYLGRIYDEVRGRPRWLVARTLGLHLNESEPGRVSARRRRVLTRPGAPKSVC